ncbi:MAG: YdcF family protein [Clostridia bacterium]|nr:YdcF family protein [Clostridia bacterium]
MKKKESNKTDKKAKKARRVFKILLKVTLILALIGILFVAVCNIVVIASANKYIVDFDTAVELDDIDCIIVLGAGLRADGTPSNILHERVECGANLYLSGASERLLLSGDHSRTDYNEVGAMKDYMVSRGIDKNVVFTDHAGFDTYDTAYRAKEIFKAEKVLIVTQDFHISRAVFIARSVGLDAYGVECDTGELGNNIFNDLREIAARPKYVLDAIFKPKPKYLGEAIPIWGEASLTDG